MTTPFHCRQLHSIAEIDAATWDALAGSDYPFLRHAFLLALEQSGCATAQTGWEGTHLLFTRTGESEPCAALPLYLKTHSMGEYVFDWSWADAYRRHGLDYYPKLISAVPFTPCAGPRLLMQDAALARELLPTLVRELKALAQRTGASSWHVLFPEETLSEALVEHGTLQRMGCQFQWFNRGYTSFEHYLQGFNSRKRKNLRKEREKVHAAGIRFERREGADIGTALWRRFYHFYASTYYVRGREPYLSPAFFEQIGQSMPEQLLMVLALQDDEPIAGALFFKGSDTLYGRYWGCSHEAQFLHFETCYYQGIDYCIDHGLARIDSGAQGEHKIQRGFEPVPTWSNHWITQPDFRRAIAAFVQEEHQHVQGYLHHTADYLPFRKDLDTGDIPQ